MREEGQEDSHGLERVLAVGRHRYFCLGLFRYPTVKGEACEVRGGKEGIAENIFSVMLI